MKNYLSVFLSAGLVLSASLLQAAQFTIDTAHSDVTFKVRHMVVSKTSGRFDKFSGEFTYDEANPQSWKANAIIDVASINTSNSDRDKHLRNEDFFDVAKYPEIKFESIKVTDVKGDKAKLHGFLEMHGVKKIVILDLILGGTMKDPWGNVRSGFEASTTINRKDFGINYNTVLDNGGLAVGEEVEISIHIEGIEKKDQKK